MKTVYDFNVKDADLNEVSLGEYQDKVLLVVNVASQCGLTPQYRGLQDLYEKFNSNGLEILGFPCNQFKGQEPGTNEEIQFFCTEKYNVSFKIFNIIIGFAFFLVSTNSFFTKKMYIFRWRSSERHIFIY